MHKFGLSSRYLGLLYERADKVEAPHARIIIERVIVVKSLKNVFRMAMRENEKEGLNQLVSNLLNCIFCEGNVVESMNEMKNGEKEDM